ncbi:MAG: T9SS type A sorting domain-containing protein [Bacteroidia bacterium]|nr:T9SS type A sorting domain-containing protein [Bacteroidia bacterium]
MRKISVFSFFLAFFIAGFAQITITSLPLGTGSNTFIVATDTLAAMGENQGSAGTNQVWDLSTLTTHSIDTVQYLDASTQPNTNDFPLANWVVQSGIGQAYARIDTNAYELHGLVGDPAGLGTNFVVSLDPITLVMPFPYTYGTAWLDTTGLDVTMDASSFGVPLVDSGRYKSIQYRDVQVDGWGSLKLGQANYPSVLREKEVTRTIDTLWAHSLFGWNIFQTTDATDSTFRWWDKNKAYTLATVVYSDGVISRISYLDPNPVAGVSPEQTAYRGVTIYPNPVREIAVAEVTDPNATRLVLLDSQGRRVGERRLTPGKFNLNLQGLPAGIYLYQVQNSSGEALGGGKLILE